MKYLSLLAAHTGMAHLRFIYLIFFTMNIRLEPAKILSELRPRRREVILGVTFFYTKSFLKELSFF